MTIESRKKKQGVDNREKVHEPPVLGRHKIVRLQNPAGKTRKKSEKKGRGVMGKTRVLRPDAGH